METTVRGSRGQLRVQYEFKDIGFYVCRCSIRNGSGYASVTDYLADAPPGIVEDLLGFMFGGKKGNPGLYEEYVSSDEFIQAKRPEYLARGSFTCTSEGKYRSLSDSVQRLFDAGFLDESDMRNTYITWTKRKTKRILGRCHSMFRVISISPILDSPDVREECLDFVVYHEFLHIRQGLRTGKRHHDTSFRLQERAFPGYGKIQEELSRL